MCTKEPKMFKLAEKKVRNLVSAARSGQASAGAIADLLLWKSQRFTNWRLFNLPLFHCNLFVRSRRNYFAPLLKTAKYLNFLNIECHEYSLAWIPINWTHGLLLRLNKYWYWKNWCWLTNIFMIYEMHPKRKGMI